MKIRFEIFPHTLQFKFEAGTSRGSFKEKETWFIKAYRSDDHSCYGLGEASPLKGLSIDYSQDYALKLLAVLDALEGIDFPEEGRELLDTIAENTPQDMPSLRFGVETALLDLINGGQRIIFDNSFSKGDQRIPINGLIWMGDEDFMSYQIQEKLKKGYDTLKMKIGAIDFETELKLLENLRDRFTSEELTLRVDANGAFSKEDVFEKLEALASADLHSIEQPIKPGQWDLMHQLCQESLLPIALDEELIGVTSYEDKKKLLESIRPQFIILKPSLVGGILECQEWIELAESQGVGWWMTSMLEANVGLNAIAQFTAQYEVTLPQGLGTGQLYHNNIDSPLEIRRGKLLYNSPKGWKISI